MKNIIDVRRERKMSTPSKLAVLVLGASVGLSGCREPSSKDIYKEGKVEGYEAIVRVDGIGRRLAILPEGKSSESRLIALDNENDGRFDEINLENIPKGSPLEAYASLDKLEQAYNCIVNEQ